MRILIYFLLAIAVVLFALVLLDVVPSAKQKWINLINLTIDVVILIELSGLLK